MAMTVGRMYSEVPGSDGTQRWSTSTRARIDSSTMAGSSSRDAEIVRGAVEAACMVGEAEQADLAVLAAERLQAVEDRLAVVQDAARPGPG